jgi:hypothetical protein
MLLRIVLSLVHLNAQIGIPFVPYAVIKVGNTLGSLHMVRVQVTGAYAAIVYVTTLEATFRVFH